MPLDPVDAEEWKEIAIDMTHQYELMKGATRCNVCGMPTYGNHCVVLFKQCDFTKYDILCPVCYEWAQDFLEMN